MTILKQKEQCIVGFIANVQVKYMTTIIQRMRRGKCKCTIMKFFIIIHMKLCNIKGRLWYHNKRGETIFSIELSVNVYVQFWSDIPGFSAFANAVSYARNAFSICSHTSLFLYVSKAPFMSFPLKILPVPHFSCFFSQLITKSSLFPENFTNTSTSTYFIKNCII